jgi:hypothetical protein
MLAIVAALSKVVEHVERPLVVRGGGNDLPRRIADKAIVTFFVAKCAGKAAVQDEQQVPARQRDERLMELMHWEKALAIVAPGAVRDQIAGRTILAVRAIPWPAK